MKRIAVIFLFLAAVGCSDFGSHTDDSFWPFGDPNAPVGQSETFQRVRGDVANAAPIESQEGNVWPGQPDAMPTLQDVSNPGRHFSDSFHHSLETLNKDLDNQLDDGEALSVGESVSRRYGVHRRSEAAMEQPLPSHVPDNASRYMEQIQKGAVMIPNGDGTTTVVEPDGSVRVVRGDVSDESSKVDKRKKGLSSHSSEKHEVHHTVAQSSEESNDKNIGSKELLHEEHHLHRGRHHRKHHKKEKSDIKVN